MKVPYSYLTEQFKNSEQILEAFRAQIDRCQFTFGRELEEFENNMAQYTGAKYVLGTSSGTMALSLLLKASGVSYKDEVITVSQTFIATVGSIVAIGARPYYVDVLDDFTMAPDLIEQAITPRTKAIMPVHYSGNPAQMERIMEIADKHNIQVIEDACCTISGKIKGKHVGNFGISGAFSVHPLKNLNVWGDGGFIITNSKKLYDKIFLLRNHGLKGRDEVEILGYKARLDTVQDIVGNYLFKKIDNNTEKRNSTAKKYDGALSSKKLSDYITIPPRRKDSRHVYHMYMIQAKNRDMLLQFLVNKGVEAKVHYPIPVHLQKASMNQKEPFQMTDLSKTEAQCKSLITLPVHQHLTDEQIDYVIDCIYRFYEEELWK